MIRRRYKRLQRVVAIWILSVAMVVHVAAASQRQDTSAEPQLLLQKGQTLAVIGLTREASRHPQAEQEILKNQRLGFGLNSLLAQLLFDTGHFRLLEEKDIHQRELLEALVRTYWLEPAATYSEDVLERVAVQLGVNLLADGSVSHSVVSSGRVSLGPFSRTTQTLRIGVTVCLYEAATHARRCGKGEGKSQQKGVGIVYEFRDDQIAFERSAAGVATKEALAEAVQALMTRVAFRP